MTSLALNISYNMYVDFLTIRIFVALQQSVVFRSYIFHPFPYLVVVIIHPQPLHASQYLFAPLDTSLALFTLFGRLSLNARVHVVIVHPSPTNRRSPPQFRLQPRSFVHTRFPRLVVVQTSNLHTPLHVLLSPNKYMALLG